MKTTIARRTATTVRAALAIVAFTVLAAVGFAAAQSFRPLTESPVATATNPPASSAHKNLGAAPAACPLPASAFTVR